MSSRLLFFIQGRYMKLLLLLAITFLPAGFASASPIFEYKGKAYDMKNISPSAKKNLYTIDQEHFTKLTSLADWVVVDQHVQELASKQSKPVDQVNDELFKVKDPTTAEIKAFFEKHKAEIPFGFDKAKDRIKQKLERDGYIEKRSELLEKLKKKGKFKMLTKKPEAPVFKINTAGYPKKGSKKPKLKIVEFADYQCPHCAHAHKVFKEVLKKMSNDVELVYIDFPLNRSGISRLISEGGHCADKQGKFWPYHDMAFEGQKNLSKSSPAEFAKKLKLDQKQFSKCVASPKTKKFIDDSMALGSSIGVSSTPSIYVNGKIFNLSHETDEALKQLKAMK